MNGWVIGWMVEVDEVEGWLRWMKWMIGWMVRPDWIDGWGE